MRKIVLTGCFSTLMIVAGWSQSTLNAGGGGAEINGNHYAYSIGEMTLVNTATSPNIIVTQGVLQPVESSGEVGIEDNLLTSDSFKVYPNPTKDIINLKANFTDGGNLKVKVYDALGKEVMYEDWRIYSGQEVNQLNVQELAVGTYTLIVSFVQNNMESIKAFKIQKLQ